MSRLRAEALAAQNYELRLQVAELEKKLETQAQYLNKVIIQIRERSELDAATAIKNARSSDTFQQLLMQTRTDKLRLQRELLQATDKVAYLERTLHASCTETKQAESQLRLANDSIARMRMRLADLKNEKAKADEMLTNLKDEKAKADEMLANLKDEKAKADESLANVKKELARIKSLRSTDKAIQELEKFKTFERKLDEILTCGITHEILRDPVIVQSGHSFEREYLQDWKQTCKRNGKRFTNPFNPHATIYVEVDNRGLKEVAWAFHQLKHDLNHGLC